MGIDHTNVFIMHVKYFYEIAIVLSKYYKKFKNIIFVLLCILQKKYARSLSSDFASTKLI